jgi:STE24 endopeptidase
MRFFRNSKSEHAAKPAPIPGLDLARAKRYSRTRLAVLALSTLWTVARLGWFANDRRAARLKEGIARRAPDARLNAAAFFAVVSALSWLLSLPIVYVGGYLVERRFGLTRQSPRGWLGDQVKGLLLGTAIQTPLLVAAYAVMRRRPRDWWLVLAAAAVPLTVLFSHLAPVLLLPRFNRFLPLRNERIATHVRALAARGGVRVSDVYEMDMSRQSEKPNAFFVGLGHSKRIVLGDTLIERFPEDEIVGVVAHELGHQVHADIWRLIGFGAGAGFALAALLGRAAPAAVRRTASRTGVTSIGDEASLPVLALLMTGFDFVLMPIQAAFSRAIERRADRYALEATGDGEAYARAMERLAAESLSDPDPPRAVVLLLASHPPLVERITTARAFKGRAAARSEAPSTTRQEA